MNARDKALQQLGGIRHGFVWESKDAAVEAIRQLATCEEHEGCHHFAVISEGHGVAFSEVGLRCLILSGKIPPEVAPKEEDEDEPF